MTGIPLTEKAGNLPGIDREILLRLFRENFTSQRGAYAIGIVAMAVVAASTALTAWIMRDLVDGMMIAGDMTKVYYVATFLAVVFVTKGIGGYIQGISLARAGNAIIADKQEQLYDYYLAQGVGFFQRITSSDLLIRITHNAQAARQVIDTIVTSFVRDLLTLVGLLIVMVYQQPALSLVSLVAGPIALFSIRLLLKSARKHTAAGIVSLSRITQTVQETISGIRVVKAFSLEPVLRARMSGAIRDMQRQSNRIARLEAATGPIMETLAGFAIAGLIGLSGILVTRYGHTPGELMSFVTALLLAYDPARRMARTRVTIETGLVGVRLMYEMLDHPIRLADNERAEPLPPGAGEVRLRDVTFGYNSEKPLIDHLDLTFEAGRMTALVGPSGGGKSTILNLVMRLYDPASGTVEIDGHDLRHVTIASLRDRIAYVGQDTFMFDGSVRHNIALGRLGAGEDEIVAAARAANAHDFIMALPDGYDTEVGEDGGKLSGGQRQRVAIARAILRDAPILILDEPTSSLDAESEALIADALDLLSKGRTTIVIAHRLSTIARAQHIIVIENGAVAEQGTQRELLRRKGKYRQLFDKQLIAAADDAAE